MWRVWLLGGWLIGCDGGGIPVKGDDPDDSERPDTDTDVDTIDSDSPDSDPPDSDDPGGETDSPDDSDVGPVDTGAPPPACLVEAWRAEVGALGVAVTMDEVGFVLPADNGGAWVVGRGPARGERHAMVLGVGPNGSVAWQQTLEIGLRSKVRAAVRGRQDQIVLALETETMLAGAVERNVAVVRVNADQTQPWLQQYGIDTTEDESPTSLALDAGGDAWVTGPAGVGLFVLRISNGLGVIVEEETFELAWETPHIVVDADQLPVLAYLDPVGGAQMLLGLERDIDVRWSTPLAAPLGGVGYRPLLAPGDGEGVRLVGAAGGNRLLASVVDAGGDVDRSTLHDNVALGLAGELDVSTFIGRAPGSFAASGDAILVTRSAAPFSEALLRVDGDDGVIRWTAPISDQPQRSFTQAVGIPGAAFAAGGDGRGAVLQWVDAATGAVQCAQRPLPYPEQSLEVGWMDGAPVGGVLIALERTIPGTGERSLVLVRYETP